MRRLKAHLLSRTAIALDIECNKETGEIPPALGEVVRRVKALGLAGLDTPVTIINPWIPDIE